MRSLFLIALLLWPSLVVAQHVPRRTSLARNDNGTFWEFSPEQPYHAAAVRVSGPNGQGGSGTLVGTNGNLTLVVTNHHVVQIGNSMSVGNTIQVHMLGGQHLTATHLQSTPLEDVAVYGIQRNDLPVVAIGSEDPPPGAVIDTMGFGGPWHTRNAFRPFIAKTVTTTKALAVDAPSISGDSGAGMIWENVLVGVQWGADSAPIASAGVSTGQSVPLVYPATSSANTGFLQRFLSQACGPYGCQPIVGRPGYLIPRVDQKWARQPKQFPGPEQFYRPANTQPIQPQEPQLAPQPIAANPVPQPVPDPCPDGGCGGNCCQCRPSTNLVPVTADEVAALVTDKLKGDVQFQAELIGARGENGRDGKDGERGPAGPKGDPGEITADHIDIISKQVAEALAKDPSMRGPAGPAGPAGQDASVDVDAIVNQVLERMPKLRVVLMDGTNKKIIDDETLEPGDPLVLDINKLIRQR